MLGGNVLCLDLDDNMLVDNLSLFRPGWQHVGWQLERGKIRRPHHSPEPQPQTQRHQETAAGLKTNCPRASSSLSIFPYFSPPTCFPVNPAPFAANLRGRPWALCSPCGKSQTMSCLKGVWHEIFDFRFIFINQFPSGPWVSHWGHNEFVGVVDTSDMSSFTDVNNNGDKLSPVTLLLSINYCHCRWHRWFLSLVLDFHRCHDTSD